jgi:hypothetical protein
VYAVPPPITLGGSIAYTRSPSPRSRSKIDISHATKSSGRTEKLSLPCPASHERECNGED